MHHLRLWMICNLLGSVLPLLSGCTPYEYDLTSPSLACHIGSKQTTIVDLHPIEYRFISAEGRLIVTLFNSGTNPVQLLGERSSVVGPDGQSHSLSDQTIASQAFIKLIFPPLRSDIQPSGPAIHFDVGTTPQNGGGPFPADDLNDTGQWNWNEPGNVRLVFIFQLGQSIFRQDFVLDRKQM